MHNLEDDIEILMHGDELATLLGCAAECDGRGDHGATLAKVGATEAEVSALADLLCKCMASRGVSTKVVLTVRELEIAIQCMVVTGERLDDSDFWNIIGAKRHEAAQLLEKLRQFQNPTKH